MVLFLHLGAQLLTIEMNGVQCEDVLDHAGVGLELGKVLRAKPVWTIVDDAQCTDEFAMRMSDRDPHVRADMRLAQDEFVLAEARIFQSIFDNQRLLRLDGMVAERGLLRNFAGLNADGCNDALVLRFGHGNQRDRAAELVGAMGDDAVERGANMVCKIVEGGSEAPA